MHSHLIATRVVKHFEIPHSRLVCYRDTRRHKPDPEPIVLALQHLGVSAKHTLSIGDEPRDIVASRAAHVSTVAALWGSDDRRAVLNARPDAAFDTPYDCLSYLESRLQAHS